MSTYNGAKYLRNQIDSVLGQIDVDTYLLVRDDGSSDLTTAILDEYQQKGVLKWYSGNNLGPARSFLDLLDHSPKADYYAFCDQDDYWLPEKLVTAVTELSKYGGPTLYYSNYQMTDSDLVPTTMSCKCPMDSFASSLATNYATGCTIVFSNCLADILISGGRPDYLMMHDSWITKLCLLVGGKVVFDEKSFIFYRQHGNNVVGGKHRPYKNLKRRIASFVHPQRLRYQEAMSLLKCFGSYGTTANIKILSSLKGYYLKTLLNRLALADLLVLEDKHRNRLIRWAFVFKQF